MFEKDFTIHSNKPGEGEAFALKDFVTDIRSYES